MKRRRKEEKEEERLRIVRWGRKVGLNRRKDFPKERKTRKCYNHKEIKEKANCGGRFLFFVLVPYLFFPLVVIAP